MQKLLIALMTAMLVLIPTGCTTTGEGGGLTPIEEMSEGQFQTVTTIVTLGTKLGVGQLLSSGTIEGEGRDILETVASTLRDVAEQPASESVTTVLSEALSNIEALNEYANRATILSAVRFAEGYIMDRGGFGVVQTETGEWALSDRSKALVLAVVEGVEAALANNPEPASNSEGAAYRAFSVEGIMTESFRRAEIEVNGQSFSSNPKFDGRKWGCARVSYAN